MTGNNPYQAIGTTPVQTRPLNRANGGINDGVVDHTPGPPGAAGGHMPLQSRFQLKSMDGPGLDPDGDGSNKAMPSSIAPDHTAPQVADPGGKLGAPPPRKDFGAGPT
jgi:hypothetical protein